ncbi:MAG: GNAT family N-acetyltransferase [Acidimicrobiales bacterium]
MTAGVTVRLATEGDLDELASVLGRAFDDDPVMNFVIAKRPVAPRAAMLLGLFASMHLADESVYVAVDDASGRVLGGAVWAPPGHWKVPIRAYLRHIPLLLRVVGLRGVTKISVLDAMEKRHPTELHHYLAVLGTDPDHQGKGIGSALLAPVLERCDTEGLGAYLESSKESNVPFYGRHKFEVTSPFTLKNGPTLYFMWRPAPV